MRIGTLIALSWLEKSNMSNHGNAFNTLNAQSGERRRSARHTFTAAADVMEARSHAHISARTSDLDHRGCYIDTLNPFPQGTSIVVRIARDNQSLTTMATVVYTHAAMGMGVIFETLSYEQTLILERWLANLGREPQPSPYAPAKHEAVSFSERPVAAKPTVALKPTEQPTEVLKYLVLMLVQKGVLVEVEGQALLDRLLN